jgi:ribonuclease HI
VLRYLKEGVPVLFIGGREPPPIRGKEYKLDEEQRRWWKGAGGEELGEQERLVRAGAWERVPESERAGSRYLSPCFLVPKPTKDGKLNWRLVVDLRRLNGYCRQFKCRFESLKLLGRMARKEDYLVSFDVSDAFYHVPIKEEHRKYFRFLIDGEIMQLNTLPMGWTNSPFYLTKIFRTLVKAIRSGDDKMVTGEVKQESRAQEGPRGERVGVRPIRRGARCLVYLDDFLMLFATKEDAEAGSVRARALLERLGLHWEERKCQWEPVQRLEHLGLEVDTVRGLFLVTPKRVNKLEREATDLICRGNRARRLVPCRLLAKFCGLAQSVDLAVPAARFFLRELYTCLSAGVDKTGWEGQARLSRQGLRDLQWWTAFNANSAFNGRSIWRASTSATLHCDAAIDGKGRGGWGAVLNGKVPARGFWRAHQRGWHITRLELLAVRLGVETFLGELRGRRVRLFEDNQAVVRFLEVFSSKSPELQGDIRKLFWLLTTNDIELVGEYIKSEDNVEADGLSRWVERGSWAINRGDFLRYHQRPGWGPYTWDRFADINNRVVEAYNAVCRDPGCPPENVDGLAQTHSHWRGEVNWCDPPWGLLPQLVQKLRESGARATVVVPHWRTATWWTDLMELTEEMDVLPPRADLFTPAREAGSGGIGPATWSTAICRVPGRAAI